MDITNPELQELILAAAQEANQGNIKRMSNEPNQTTD